MRNYDGATQGSAKLVLLVRRPDAVKEIPSIQLVVAQKLVYVPVKLVGSGLNACIENRPVSAAELRTVGVGLHLEFLQRIHRRLNDVTRVVEEISEIGIVVDAV